ncbi:unnamed protein product [Ceratitis capitata]|uniref:(Mediterranean fruit fly) hypothetical protein n=1 Tax=Ceratitis capitata TaxID=7213 RepID=A0A811U4Z5_CERCA|nr:unnamed protein product [Ceratitis capitata]
MLARELLLFDHFMYFFNIVLYDRIEGPAAADLIGAGVAVSTKLSKPIFDDVIWQSISPIIFIQLFFCFLRRFASQKIMLFTVAAHSGGQEGYFTPHLVNIPMKL